MSEANKGKNAFRNCCVSFVVNCCKMFEILSVTVVICFEYFGTLLWNIVIVESCHDLLSVFVNNVSCYILF